MKKLLISFAIAASSISAMAQPILFAESSDKTEQWFGHPESFEVLQDAYSVMMTRKLSRTNVSERSFMAVEFTTCKRGYGPLYGRNSISEKWSEIYNVTLNSPSSVGDSIADILCEVGKKVNGSHGKTTKPQKQKSNSNNI